MYLIKPKEKQFYAGCFVLLITNLNLQWKNNLLNENVISYFVNQQKYDSCHGELDRRKRFKKEVNTVNKLVQKLSLLSLSRITRPVFVIRYNNYLVRIKRDAENRSTWYTCASHAYVYMPYSRYNNVSHIDAHVKTITNNSSGNVKRNVLYNR